MSDTTIIHYGVYEPTYEIVYTLAFKHGWLENTLYMEANSWENLYFRKQAMFDYRRVITKRGILNSWMISCNLFSIITLKWLVV